MTDTPTREPSVTAPNEDADELREFYGDLTMRGGRFASEVIDAALRTERLRTIEEVREQLMELDGFRPDGERRINAYNDDIEEVLDDVAGLTGEDR